MNIAEGHQRLIKNAKCVFYKDFSGVLAQSEAARWRHDAK